MGVVDAGADRHLLLFDRLKITEHPQFSGGVLDERVEQRDGVVGKPSVGFHPNQLRGWRASPCSLAVLHCDVLIVAARSNGGCDGDTSRRHPRTVGGRALLPLANTAETPPRGQTPGREPLLTRESAQHTPGQGSSRPPAGCGSIGKFNRSPNAWCPEQRQPEGEDPAAA